MPRQRDHALLTALGARLAQLRRDRGWTQERLAEAMSVEPVSLSRWETGSRALSISVLAVAADKLEVSLGDLLDVEREIPQPSRDPDEVELLQLYRSLGEERRDLALRLLREVARRR